ncbi:Do/DeqQ family serine endopeptidase [Candidatus Bealeia paramacronuclearis]|uniref:Do/DeqQ family serine endopeptidase n=1 Tax=Candidatus Bealeia paramacronuclearis TaxID=1921001 RepID=A0ABZ2C802_9PROT|nr:Do/DeqQ family serine endopeptidase [Candidatus Bealeia paramacronuclearis]
MTQIFSVRSKKNVMLRSFQYLFGTLIQAQGSKEGGAIVHNLVLGKLDKAICFSFLLILSACGKPDNPSQNSISETCQKSELTFSSVVKKFAPTVVNIYASSEVQTKTPMDTFMDDPFYKQYMERLHGPHVDHKLNSMGSGVIVSEDGHILTNYHVIEGGDTIRVILHDRREFEAKIVASEQRTDLVMLKIDVGSEKLPFAVLDPIDNLNVGDMVLAIGNPFGVGQSVSSGIISAVGRSQSGISDFRSFIQTDASINPGNSGGALVTGDGRLIGINTAIYSKSGESIGIGFAIPSPLVIPFVESALQGKRTERPWMGIRIRGVDMETSRKLGFTHPYGVLIKEIYKGGVADQVGIQVGDILTHFNDQIIEDDAELDYVLSRQHLDTTVTFKVYRNGKEKNIQVNMKAPPEASNLDSYEIQGKNPLTGAVVAELSPALALDLGADPLKRGIVILDIKPNSLAENLKLNVGDIIHNINEQELIILGDFFKIVKAAPQKWSIKFFRNNKHLTLEVGKS